MADACARAEADARKDILDECDDIDEVNLLLEPEPMVVDLVSPAYFGSYIVVCEDPENPMELHDMMLSATSSEDEAVGDIYRTLSEEYPFWAGWRIKSIVVHPNAVGLFQREVN
jgi:hypothetical protein